MMPGSASGSVHGKERPESVGAQRRRGVLKPAVDRLERQPDGANQQRKRHHAAGERRTGPAEREHDAEMVGEKGADGALSPERDQQQIAGHHRRQHQRQMHDAVEQRLAPEVLPRQEPCDGDAERQRHHGRDHGDAERQRDRGPFVGGEVKHASASLPAPGGGASASQRVRAKRGPMTGTASRGGTNSQRARKVHPHPIAPRAIDLPPPGGGEERKKYHDVGLIRNVNPYVSNTVFAKPERRNARYCAASGLAFAVSATG